MNVSRPDYWIVAMGASVLGLVLVMIGMASGPRYDRWFAGAAIVVIAIAAVADAVAVLR